ncbi:MAG: nucleotidyltransferase family protein [Candidatus Coatesbacteria bacterium]|nr:nucleotidyltransferase family protein [Candidatus Coatesbacteria bacterium]
MGELDIKGAVWALPKHKIAEFCRRWQIVEFALFGSSVRGDFGPESDIDVLVTFTPDAPWSLFELVEMQQELEGIFDRKVHLIEEAALKNPFRRRAILREKEVIYAAQ